MRTSAYIPPAHHTDVPLLSFLSDARAVPELERQRFVNDGTVLHYAGELSLLNRPCVSIVGTRAVSAAGAARARRLARELVDANVVVVSGLAKGVDANAHKAAIDAGGRTVAVIGTPLDTAYPAENKRLQEQIYREHLLVSQFSPGSRVFQGNFPARNRVMAALSDATVIIEAGETSGTLHQAVECRKLGRWLFIAKSVVDNPDLTWPAGFIGLPRVRILSSTEDLLAALRESGSWR
ncbi:DNA-processing protein DprA [Myxococcus xanthus]|uniref:DNA-processing protein DprA n=1 Tax=Myxococcus xanthus TaxID=34 RepID=UPI0019178272|nr:DNA-processing protein DprA [Myxococcus xanthus]QQR46545.1 DNA-processing protein DprA [Myxococcus xanthus]